MDVFEFRQGDSPLLLSIPHAGTGLPHGFEARLTPAARRLPDTDWHVPRLYSFVDDWDVTVVKANYSRYIIDINRPPDNEDLYPGQASTGLCPALQFNGDPIYVDGEAVGDDEVKARREQYWQPYHDKLSAELSRIKSAHGHVVMYDCHSIASVVPRLFEGTLATLNFGTVRGASCAAYIESAVSAILEKSDYRSAINGRFVGGYITRHYGNPGENVHAVQMELACASYMNEQSFEYENEKARVLQATLEPILRVLYEWAPN